MPLSLMESADRGLISMKCSKHAESHRLARSRSNLSCHHVMIACAIGGEPPLYYRSLPYPNLPLYAVIGAGV